MTTDGRSMSAPWPVQEPNTPSQVLPVVSQQARVAAVEVLSREMEELERERMKLHSRILDLAAAKRLLRQAL